ncbi:DUF2752 domain-containing protein [Spongisporangium articulatum]|uniref:DUF2752 domain-containing protein n=1 Tax=Spongisporangium articulatum TaxID=3362603 RepID=A0ABW8ARC7_9ACTN
MPSPTAARPSEPAPPLTRYLPVAGLTAVVAGAVATLAVVDPHQAGHYPTCPFLALTGWYCPGCGSLRAVHDLTRGDLTGALGMNPLFVVLLPVLLGLYLNWWRRLVTGRYGPGHPPSVPGWVPVAVPVLVLAFWVLRNLPFGAVLAP